MRSRERPDLSWLKEAVGDRSAPLTLGAEEEFHIVDLDSRELVPRAPELLARLPEEGFSPELHRSCVETNTPVCDNLDQLRANLHRQRVVVAEMADTLGLGIIGAGTVPLIGHEDLAVTPTARYERMVDDYQMLAREQLICGAQVHVGLPNRDVAVVVAQRVAPWLPVLLGLSASSPFWRGQDSGYASVRSLLWQRWPTRGCERSLGTRSRSRHARARADRVRDDHRSGDDLLRRAALGARAHARAAGQRRVSVRGRRGAVGGIVPRAGSARAG